MSRLSDFKLLSFDVYGTLIDWESGLLAAFQPLLARSDAVNKHSKQEILKVYHEYENKEQTKRPDMIYSEILAAVLPQVAAKLNLETPTTDECSAFGGSIGSWPAFSDTVDALKRLSKHYKLVVLSNVDRESFTKSNAGPLEGVHFDAILTAQDIGSYKPDLRNFRYMLKEVDSRFSIKPDEVLQTAQSQFHDHHPAKKIGLKSVWIARSGAEMGNRDQDICDWKFDTLGQMADALEQELAA